MIVEEPYQSRILVVRRPKVDPSQELQAIEPLTQKSPLPGFEYVRGFGVFALPFDSGHIRNHP